MIESFDVVEAIRPRDLVLPYDAVVSAVKYYINESTHVLFEAHGTRYQFSVDTNGTVFTPPLDDFTALLKSDSIKEINYRYGNVSIDSNRVIKIPFYAIFLMTNLEYTPRLTRFLTYDADDHIKAFPNGVIIEDTHDNKVIIEQQIHTGNDVTSYYKTVDLNPRDNTDPINEVRVFCDTSSNFIGFNIKETSVRCESGEFSTDHITQVYLLVTYTFVNNDDSAWLSARYTPRVPMCDIHQYRI